MEKLGKVLKICGALFALISIIGLIAAGFDFVIVIGGAALPLIDLTLAIIFFVLGMLFYAGGIFIQKKWKVEQVEVTLDMNELDFIEASIKKTRNRSLVMGLCIGTFALFMIAIPFVSDEDMGTAADVSLCIFGSIFLLLALVLLYQYSKLRNVRLSDVYHVIMFQPNTITQFQTVIVESKAGKSFNAMNVTLSVGKKRLTTLAVSESEMQLLKQYLLRHNADILLG